MKSDIIFLHYSNISEAEKKNSITCPSNTEEFSSQVIKNFAFVNRKKAATPFFKHNFQRATICCCRRQ
jgi:hypothetical protein